MNDTKINGHNLLGGVRVLDASRVLAGPYCGQILGDLGADVIKVERPGQGDETRSWGPPFIGTLSAYYLSCNRNKRSVAIDLAKKQGRAIFQDLVKKCDILLENFRADSAEKLGVGPETLLKTNPRLIICSISGYGRTGPLCDLPGYDNAIQARSGLMSITGPPEGPPYKVGVALTDVLTGLYAATAVLACLHARQQSGHGYTIDLALLDCALASQVNVAQAYLTTGEVPARQGNEHLQIVPYQAFQTADNWMVLTVGNDGQWQRFCAAVQRPDLAADERFKTNTLRVQHRRELIPVLQTLFSSQSSEHWQQVLQKHDVPHAPVWDYAQIFDQEHIRERNMRVNIRTPEGKPVDLIGSPFHINGKAVEYPQSPPGLGQQTAEVLNELLKIDPDKLNELKQQGIIG